MSTARMRRRAATRHKSKAWCRWTWRRWKKKHNEFIRNFMLNARYALIEQMLVHSESCSCLEWQPGYNNAGPSVDDPAKQEPK